MTYAEKNAYGVCWKLCADDGTDYDAPCQRLGLAEGLRAVAYDGNAGSGGFSDFDAVYPWSQIRRCNLIPQADGSVSVVYREDDAYRPDKEVFVEIPRHYYRRYRADGYEYRFISETPQEGFQVDPAFVENGRELPYIYVSAYECAGSNGESISGAYPLMDLTRTEYRTLATSKGLGFGSFDLRTLLMLQNLYLIEFADRNCQNAIGGGFGKILQPHRTNHCTRPEKHSNRIVTSEAVEESLWELWPGCACSITSYDFSQNVYAYRTITGIFRWDEAGAAADLLPGEWEIRFDGTPMDITEDMCIGGAPQRTGSTDALPYHTGKTKYYGHHDPLEVFRCGVLYRGMENLWGNAWSRLDGVNIENGKTLICDNMTQYSDDNTHYHSHGILQEIQVSNDGIGIPCEVHYIKNLGYDPEKPWLALPESSVGIEKDLAYSFFLQNHSFGDYYYLNTTSNHYVHGGGFDHYWRCGLFTLRGWATPDSRWYLYGSRNIYKPLR